MRRRDFIARLGGTVLALPLAALAQRAASPMVGILYYDQRDDLILDGLRQFGYVQGKNLAIEQRDAHGKSERLHALAKELVQLRVDVIVARGTAPARAAKEVTTTIPIVMAPADDPVGTGLVSNLARPGGNITGVSVLSWAVEAKRMQLLKAAMPTLSRIGVLWVPANPGHERVIREVEREARSMKMEVHAVGVRDPDDLNTAFQKMVEIPVGAIDILGDAMLGAQQKRIIELAARNKLPAIYFRGGFVEAGGLMSYGTDVAKLVRRGAYFVDKLLKGAKAADLPIEQATEFELAINLKTAAALGIKMPQSLLVRADKLIE